MDNVICRRCIALSETGENLKKSIEEYVASLNKEIKVSDDVYSCRLSKCNECDALVNGLCKYCGCFVMARAAKKNMYCPYPKNKKW